MYTNTCTYTLKWSWLLLHLLPINQMRNVCLFAATGESTSFFPAPVRIMTLCWLGGSAGGHHLVQLPMEAEPSSAVVQEVVVHQMETSCRSPLPPQEGKCWSRPWALANKIVLPTRMCTLVTEKGTVSFKACSYRDHVPTEILWFLCKSCKAIVSLSSLADLSNVKDFQNRQILFSKASFDEGALLSAMAKSSKGLKKTNIKPGANFCLLLGFCHLSVP